MQIFEVVCDNYYYYYYYYCYYYKISVLVKCIPVCMCIISSQASSWVVVSHVSSHPSILHTSSMPIKCVISKQSFYKLGLALGVSVPAALIGYL